MKIVLIALSLLMLSGCGYLDRASAYIKGYTIICVKETGVSYVVFNTGAAVLLNKQGQPVACQ